MLQKRRQTKMIYTYTDDNVPLNKVGGKAYNLAHLGRVKSIRVPKWICLSTDVFYEFLGERAKEYQRLLQSYTPKNREKIIRIINECEFSEELRDKIQSILDTISKDERQKIMLEAVERQPAVSE